MTPPVATGDALERALAHPCDGPLLALCGPAGSGKSSALIGRALSLARANPGRRFVCIAPSEAALARLQRRAEPCPQNLEFSTPAGLAFAMLGERAIRIGDASAAAIFEETCASLFALEWPEIAAAHIDPEVTGLRSPERFAASAFALFRKLRAALIGPAQFRTLGLQGATAFYGRPPNLAGSELLLETAQKYRDSLRAGPAELERQRAREVDLTLILARLYEAYDATMRERGVATSSDALFLAVEARAPRAGFASAFVDDAQDLTGAELALLASQFGTDLRGVTVAGDPDQATRGFAGARGSELFTRAEATIAFGARATHDPAIARVARRGLDPLTRDVAPQAHGPAVTLYRTADRRSEVAFVASEVERAIAGGTKPSEIAIVTRNLDCAHDYIAALLDRDVPLDLGGSADLYAFRAVLDTLAAWWAALDPFRHDFLMRNLEAPWLALADASIAILCGEPRDPQPALFEIADDDDDDEARAKRWDRSRDVRLGLNLTRGDVDAELPPETRERLDAFRIARARWAGLARSLSPAALARAIASESTLATLEGGARGRFDAGLIERLIARVEAFERRAPLGTLEDFLLDVDRTRRLELESEPLACADPSAVRVLDVEAAKGEFFETVFVPDVRAGAWPQYYTPDAFLFTPKLGMIAKENAGDGAAARTAKFTYAMYRGRFREKYYAEQRRAFYCAATRARSRLFVSAGGRATRGASAPEILAELERAAGDA